MQESNLQNHAFVKAFIFSVIKTISQQNIQSIPRKKKYKINTDIIPHIPEHIIKSRLMGKNKIKFQPSIIHKPQETPQPKTNTQQQPTQKPGSIPLQKSRTAYQLPQQGEYGKLTILLKDPSIVSIECPGSNKNIIITRKGFKQPTKISLTEQEIKTFLETIAQESRIPLIEGVFRAAVDDFVVNAIISKTISTRFLIKKRTPYSMLSR